MVNIEDPVQTRKKQDMIRGYNVCTQELLKMNWPFGSELLLSVSSTRGKLDFTSPHSTVVVYSEPLFLSVKNKNRFLK